MKQFYYHLTTSNLGKVKILTPLHSDDKKVQHRADTEPETPRICVAPTIGGCLLAIYTCLSAINPKINIYRTYNKVKAENPNNVKDSTITGEKWLIKPTKFILIGSIKTASFVYITEKEKENIIPNYKHSLDFFISLVIQKGEQFETGIKILEYFEELWPKYFTKRKGTLYKRN